MLDKIDPNRNRQDIYDTAAAEWWSDETRWVRTLKNMVPGRLNYFDRFLDWDGALVLDLGCAGGFMSEAIAKRGARVTGIDPSRPAIEAAKQHARGENLEIDYVVGVGEDLPFKAGHFDSVVCVDVLEHVEDLEKVLSEVARVLKPGGVFLFDTINRSRLAAFVTVTVAEDMLGILPKGTHDPAKYIKPAELEELLDKTGFDVGNLTGLGPRGVNLRGDAVFGRLPGTFVIYMGTATLAKAA